MSIYTIHHGSIRTLLTLSEAQRALRALRPSYRSITLPQRWVSPSPRHLGDGLVVPTGHEVPVFEKRSRLAH